MAQHIFIINCGGRLKRISRGIDDKVFPAIEAFSDAQRSDYRKFRFRIPVMGRDYGDGHEILVFVAPSPIARQKFLRLITLSKARYVQDHAFLVTAKLATACYEDYQELLGDLKSTKTEAHVQLIPKRLSK